MISLLALLLGLLALASPAHGAGELDSTFDGDGRVVTDFGGFDSAFSVAIQADGKIVAAGGSSEVDFALARYNPDGTLDTSFDGDGRVLTDFGAFEQAVTVAIQTDGKIVAAGRSGGDFALARYNPDGSLDPSFDGDGKVVTDFGENDGAFSVAIQADGKIVAAGESFFVFALARYNPDGTLDASFDGDGRVLTDFGAFDQAFAVAIQTDGRILAAGKSFSGAGDSDFALARYNPDGTLDTSFDGDGRALTDFVQGDEANGVVIQADGKIVAAGASAANPNPVNFALARYNPDGTLDTSFDGDGRVVTDFGSTDQANGVAIQADGQIVAAGFAFRNSVDEDLALARYNPDGSLDPSFDGDGMAVTDFGAFERAFAVAIQADGKIVAAGRSGDNFALARYLPNGVPANLPPDCSTVTPSQNRLWPPNHTLRLVSLGGGTDLDDDVVTLAITSVTQDESLNGRGDGDKSPDAQAGTESGNVRLRAERSGTGDGRVYRLSFTGSDGEGGNCSGTVTVGVPKNMGARSTPVDSAPPSFNSFG